MSGSALDEARASWPSRPRVWPHNGGFLVRRVCWDSLQRGGKSDGPSFRAFRRTNWPTPAVVAEQGARVDARRVVSGLIHVLQSGGRWRDAPAVYGPSRTRSHRFVRGARKGGGPACLRGCPRRVAAGGAAAGFDSRQGPSIGGGRQRGAHRQASGRSRGGRTPKIQAAVDEAGRPRRLILGPGQRGAAPGAVAPCPPAPAPLSGRYGLRQRCLPGVVLEPRLPTAHPQQPDPETPTSLRSRGLPGAQCH